MTDSRQHIHLIGICGTAMASVAGLLQLKGHRITGSDQAAYPPMSDLLGSLGIPIAEPFQPDNLQPAPDLVVVGNAISRGNPELEALLDSDIPFTSAAAILHDEFLQGRRSLVVSGTHGKTTTTSMLAWIYEVASREQPELAPSFLIGGVAENFGQSFQLRPTAPFILEGDEYDTAFFDKGPKFMHYFPNALVLTHVEFDHADIYTDLTAVKTAFKRLVNLLPRGGRVIAFDGSANVSECVAKAFCAVDRYGFGEDSAWRIAAMEHRGNTTEWTLLHRGEHFADLTLPMAGEHNALNATAAAALAASQGIPARVIADALASFQSVKRRLEVRAVVDGVTVIDDFAHHPTAIRETLRALRAAYPGARLWAVLEPRSNTLRRNIFEGELVEALGAADRIVLAGVFKSEAIPEAERLHPEAILVALAAAGHEAALYPNADGIVAAITPELSSGDVVAVLSNGGFDNIYEKLPAALRARVAPEPATEPDVLT
jgi:UDP-N-acetylmuramate: L-alanyl-gamma-D-glutamyl-meso-diaminopimelate ligase